MFRSTSLFGICSCLPWIVPLIVAAGCGKPASAPATAMALPAVTELIQEKSQSPAPESQPASLQTDPEPKHAAEPDSDSSSTKSKLSLESLESFQSPFRNRADIFVPPQRTQQAVRQDTDTNDTVALRGFVHVDQLQVVLNIDGTIAPMKEGEKKYGVHVLSIEPPKVVLQRGRERWTATLDR